MEKDSVVEDETNVKGYGYWKREGDLIGNEQFIPKVVSNPEELKLENKNSVGSAWNTAGTWEEKHYNKNSITEYFNNNLNVELDSSVKALSIKAFSGDAYTFFVRQKAKLVYDCSFTLVVSVDGDETDIELTDVANHELDAEFEFSYKKHSTALKKHKKEIEKLVQKLFNDFWEAQKK